MLMALNKHLRPLRLWLNRRQKFFSALNRKNKNKGFALIELVVVSGIFIIVTIAIFTNYPAFRDMVSLRRTVQELALVLRQAQSYGLGVREYASGSGIYPGYGVNFNLTKPDTFTLFADILPSGPPGNDLYDSSSEDIEIFKIQTGDRIYSICANEKKTPAVCGLSSANIVFYRPNPLVSLIADGSSYSDMEIKLRSPRGTIKTVVILASGQISVE